MAKNLLILLYISVAIATLNVAPVKAANEAPAASESNSGKEYGVTQVSCYTTKSKKYDHDVTKSCCKQPYADCRKISMGGSTRSDIICLVKSKENEQKMKNCCATTTKTKPPRSFAGETANGAGYEKLKSC